MAEERKILFVCMGNICRSPTAEAVFRKLVKEIPELDGLEIDSCGTIGYHVGEPPDPRAVAAADKRGYDLSVIRARKISLDDLEKFDCILTMDSDNQENLLSLATSSHLKKKIKLFLSFHPDEKISQVPDPYYGEVSGFDYVIDLTEAASSGLIEHLLNYS